ncbi:MAG: DEAD/DEAH box helicase family protein [Acidimicrobiia bacterium]
MKLPPVGLIEEILREFAAQQGEDAPDAVQEQAEAVIDIAGRLDHVGSVLLHGNTGVGKTVQALAVAYLRSALTNRPAVVLAPSKTILKARWRPDAIHLERALEALLRRSPRRADFAKLCGVERQEAVAFDTAGANRLTGRPFVVLSTKRIFGNERLEANEMIRRRNFLACAEPCLLVIDEAHHGTSPKSDTGRVLRHVLEPVQRGTWRVPLLTLSATPVRQHSNNLTDILELNLGEHAPGFEAVEDYQKAIHQLVFAWWRTGSVPPIPPTLGRLQQKSHATLRKHVVRQRPKGSDPDRPGCETVTVAADAPWLRGYGIARVLPALLREAERGQEEHVDEVLPCDSYRRMLLSSSAAFWHSAVARTLARRTSTAAQDLLRTLELLLGPREQRTRVQALLHRKVRWTVTRAKQEATTRQVLIFVEYLDTVDDLLVAFGRPKGLKVASAAHASDVDSFRDATKGMVLVASPRHQEGLDLDYRGHRRERSRLLIHHDLPWSAVALRQRHGRLQRIRRNFPSIEAVAPVMSLPDDQRLWQTVNARWAVMDVMGADILDREGVLADGAPEPSALPSELVPLFRMLPS